MKKIGILAILFFKAFFVFAGDVEIGSDSVVINNVFTLDVTINDCSDLYSSSFDIVYDPAIIDVHQTHTEYGLQPIITESVLLNENGTIETIWLSALEDSVPGRLIVGIARAGNIPGVDVIGSQVLLSISFKGIGTGITSIDFDNANLKDSNLNQITADNWINGSVEILGALTPPVDSDNDGLTNQEEINNYGTDPFEWDSDGDGFSDGQEITLGTDPLDQNSFPNLYLTYSPELGYDNTAGVDPNTGEITTIFNYKVIYVNLNNVAPTSMEVYIDNLSKVMTVDSGCASNLCDGDHTNGEQYIYSTTLDLGEHSYYFYASDGQESGRLPFLGNLSGPTVATCDLQTLQGTVSMGSTFFEHSCSLTIAEGATTFSVESEGMAVLSANNSIKLKSGTRINTGSRFHAIISACNAPWSLEGSINSNEILGWNINITGVDNQLSVIGNFFHTDNGYPHIEMIDPSNNNFGFNGTYLVTSRYSEDLDFDATYSGYLSSPEKMVFGAGITTPPIFPQEGIWTLRLTNIGTLSTNYIITGCGGMVVPN